MSGQLQLPVALRFMSANPVEPGAGTWLMVSPPDPRSFSLAPPPANNSPATRAELAELETLTHSRTPADIQQIRRWSVFEPGIASNWEALSNQLSMRYGLTPPAAARVQYAMNQALYGAVVSAWHHKYVYNRPRPSTLDPGIDVSVIPVPQHPAYPSGHSTVSGAAATVLSQFFPDEAVPIWQLALDSGMSRLKAGIHYRSDHTAGINLGRTAALSTLGGMMSDRGPLAFRRPAGVAPLTFTDLIRGIDCMNTCQRLIARGR